MGGGSGISFGSFSLSLGMTPGGRRILGYNYTESIIPIGQRIYVIGEASDSDGALIIKKPREKGKPFIVSLKSEEEIIGSHESSAKWYLVGAIADHAGTYAALAVLIAQPLGLLVLVRVSKPSSSSAAPAAPSA